MGVLLGDLPHELMTPDAFEREIMVDETGKDYAENAALKARAFAEAFGFWTLGDDTGLEVEALGGAPGLRSARLAGGDEERRRSLLMMLNDHARPWKARFVSVVALASPTGELILRQGECLGEIIPEPRGEMGFGYDPIFQLEGIGKTMAELTMDEKNRLSHRAQAVQAILPVLRDRLG